MSVIFLILGFAFLLAGFLSITGLTNVGLEYASFTQFHTLPFVNQYPSAWVYIGLGLVLVLLAYAVGRGGRRI